MVNRACIMLFALCIQFDPSLQQLQTLRKRLDYMEVMIKIVTLKNRKTQFDISKLRDAIELINNKTEGESSAHVDVSSLDAAAIADLESDMKRAINQQELTITAIAKAVSDEKKYARQQMEALKIVSETIANQSIDEIKSDLIEMNSTLKEDMIDMNNKVKNEVEENKEEILKLKQMIMEMKQTKTGYSPVAVTVSPHLLRCPDGWRKFQDTCYLYVWARVSWSVAESRCAHQGGILAEPNTNAKMRYLMRLTGDVATWLGGTDSKNEGIWVWSGSKRIITFFMWGPRQPNNFMGIQDCLETEDGYMNDENCGSKQRFICERKAKVQ